MTIDLDILTTALYTLVAVMLIVVLYHVIFIVVDLRKILRRFDDITAQVEMVIMKPLSMADQGIQWVIDFLQSKAAEQKKHAHKKVIETDREDDEENSD